MRYFVDYQYAVTYEESCCIHDIRKGEIEFDNRQDAIVKFLELMEKFSDYYAFYVSVADAFGNVLTRHSKKSE